MMSETRDGVWRCLWCTGPVPGTRQTQDNVTMTCSEDCRNNLSVFRSLPVALPLDIEKRMECAPEEMRTLIKGAMSADRPLPVDDCDTCHGYRWLVSEIEVTPCPVCKGTH